MSDTEFISCPARVMHLIVVVNKTDLISKEEKTTLQKQLENIEVKQIFLSASPLVDYVM